MVVVGSSPIGRTKQQGEKMSLRQFKFTLREVDTGKVENIKVMAHEFPAAASQVYIQTFHKRKNGWCIMSAVDEECKDDT